VYSALNGVKQGGVASPTMFCLYIDELLLKLADSGVGCWFGKFYVGVLAYADDIVSLVPSASSMRTMLSYCYHFPSQYSLVFDANKSKCIFLPGGKRRTCKPVFVVNGHSIEYVDEYVHLGRAILSDLDDARDIDVCQLAFIYRLINSVLCQFGKLDPVVKMQLLTSYCYKGKERKGKEEYLYSACIQRLKALRHGSHSFTCKLHHACLL